MIKLFLRKVFYDIWDNFFHSLVFNFMLTAICAAGVQVYARISNPLLQAAVAALFFLPAGSLLAAMSSLYGQVSDYRRFAFKDLLPALKESWKAGLALFAVLFFVLLLLFSAVPFCFFMMTIPGFLAAAFLFCLAVFLLAALQWFLPVYYRLNKDFIACIKKSFLLLFDNPGFSIFLLAFSALLLVVSILLGFIVPGWTSLLIAQQGMLRLLMFKCDWLESEEKKLAASLGEGHAALSAKRERPRVPWDELLAEEEKSVGHRTLKSFFLSWKD